MSSARSFYLPYSIRIDRNPSSQKAIEKARALNTRIRHPSFRLKLKSPERRRDRILETLKLRSSMQDKILQNNILKQIIGYGFSWETSDGRPLCKEIAKRRKRDERSITVPPLLRLPQELEEKQKLLARDRHSMLLKWPFLEPEEVDHRVTRRCVI